MDYKQTQKEERLKITLKTDALKPLKIVDLYNMIQVIFCFFDKNRI